MYKAKEINGVKEVLIESRCIVEPETNEEKKEEASGVE